MMWLLQIIGLIFTYVISSLIVFLAVARFCNRREREEEDHALHLFYLTAGLGPIAVAWILTMLLWIVPGLPDVAYLLLIPACFVAVLPLARGQWHLLRILPTRVHRGMANALRSMRWQQKFVLGVVILLLMLIVLLPLILPLVQNDPLEYATDARIIYREKSYAIYPFIVPDPETGHYAPSSHPPAYVSLITWSYMLQGGSERAGLLKCIAPAFAVHSILLLWYLLSSRGVVTALLGALLLVSTPLFFMQTAICHIDPLRIYTFFLAFVWLDEFLRRPERATSLICGAALGFALFGHSIGLLALPLFAGTFFLVAQGDLSQRIRPLLPIVGVALLVGGFHYVRNVFIFGSPIHDSAAVVELEQLHFQDYLLLKRGLMTLGDRTLYGALAGFTSVEYFGLGHWILLAGVPFYRSFIRQDRLSLIMLSVVAFYFASTFASVLLGMDLMIKNIRYLLTIQPFVIYLAAMVLGRWYTGVEKA